MADEAVKTKTYVNGHCKAIATQFWEIINFEINPKDLEKLPANDRWFVRLQMMKRRNPGKYGETHYMILNTCEWKKKEDDDNRDGVAEQHKQADDLPF